MSKVTEILVVDINTDLILSNKKRLKKVLKQGRNQISEAAKDRLKYVIGNYIYDCIFLSNLNQQGPIRGIFYYYF